MRSAARCKNALLVFAVILTCVLAVPSMALAADSVDASGKEASVSESADATKPIWEFTGVELSSSSVTSGEAVTVTPQVTGDLGGATYNYVWSYGGGWDLWGSTVRDTGRGTNEATGTLALTKPGTYTVYVDVTDRSGQTRTMSATLEVTPPSWSFTGVGLSTSSVTSGEPVTVTPQVTGDLEGAEYNYVWQRNGSWAKGEWGSTVLSTGSGTPDSSATLASEVSRAGSYTVYVDVTDRSGRTRTMSATLEVTPPSWSFSGVELSASRVTSGEAVTVTPVTSGDLDGATYNYVWQRNGSWAEGEWGSTVLSGGSGTPDTSATLASEVSRPGSYTVYVDVTDRSGEKRTMSAQLEVASPEWEFSGVRVSSSRVRVDEPVTVTPQVSGDLGGASYNYVWSYEGGWDLWGSTVRDTGKGTSEASSELSFYRPGRYVLYVDVTDRSGRTRTMSAGVEAYDDSWSLDGVTAAPAEVVAGDEVTCAPRCLRRRLRPQVQLRLAAQRLLGRGGLGLHGARRGLRHGRGLPRRGARDAGPLHPLRGRRLRARREAHRLHAGRGLGRDGGLRLRLRRLRLDGLGRPLRGPRGPRHPLPLPLGLRRRLRLRHASGLVEHGFGELLA
jgi:hypothetical protein